MSIKSTFSIKDLENLSGVKAHTIRIWEERYQLLKPERTKTNIRKYNLVNLQKILSVALLNRHGLKVSKIASLSNDEIKDKIFELEKDTDSLSQSINSFKVSMLNFDNHMFNKTYQELLDRFTFQDVFLRVFVRLLNEIGLLWMTNTISSVHEKFISSLIKQKLLLKIEEISNNPTKGSETFILFLPMNEIHELGLMYVHYELLAKGNRSIYLGPSVPTKELLAVQKVFDNITFVSYFTTQPTPATIEKYLIEISEKVLSPRNEKLHLLGRMTKDINCLEKFSQVYKHENIHDLVNLV